MAKKITNPDGTVHVVEKCVVKDVALGALTVTDENKVEQLFAINSKTKIKTKDGSGDWGKIGIGAKVEITTEENHHGQALTVVVL